MPKLELAIRGNLAEAERRDRQVLARAPAEAIKKATRRVQLAARAEINTRFRRSDRTRNGARRIANAIRSKTYVDAGGLSATGIVFSKFGRGRPGSPGFVDYLLPYVEGATLRPTRGQWLYVPIEQRTARGRRFRVSVEADKRLRWVPSSDGSRIFLVRETARRSTLVAVLVRRVVVPRSLNFDRVAREADREFFREFSARLDQVGR